MAVLTDLDLAPKMREALSAAGIETPQDLARLGFDAACEIPDVWRAAVKGAFANLEGVLNAPLREAAKRIHQDEGTIELDDDAEVSHSADGGAYVAAWVWVGYEDLDG